VENVNCWHTGWKR